MVVNPETAHTQYGFILFSEWEGENSNHYWKEKKTHNKNSHWCRSL